MQSHRIKVILSAPHILEVYEYEKSVKASYELTEEEKEKRKQTKKGESETKDKNKVQTIQKGESRRQDIAAARRDKAKQILGL